MLSAATCSLAVTTKDGTPMCVTNNDFGAGPDKRDIVLWADHRADKEAAEINASGSMVLKYVGETMSLEMYDNIYRPLSESGPVLKADAQHWQGAPKDLVAKEEHARGAVRLVHVLRPSGLPDLPRDGQSSPVELLSGLQMLLRTSRDPR